MLKKHAGHTLSTATHHQPPVLRVPCTSYDVHRTRYYVHRACVQSTMYVPSTTENNRPRDPVKMTPAYTCTNTEMYRKNHARRRVSKDNVWWVPSVFTCTMYSYDAPLLYIVDRVIRRSTLHRLYYSLPVYYVQQSTSYTSCSRLPVVL